MHHISHLNQAEITKTKQSLITCSGTHTDTEGLRSWSTCLNVMARFLSTSMNANICTPKDIYVMRMAQRYPRYESGTKISCYESGTKISMLWESQRKVQRKERFDMQQLSVLRKHLQGQRENRKQAICKQPQA